MSLALNLDHVYQMPSSLTGRSNAFIIDRPFKCLHRPADQMPSSTGQSNAFIIDRPIKCLHHRPADQMSSSSTGRSKAFIIDRPIKCLHHRPAVQRPSSSTGRSNAFNIDRPIKCLHHRPADQMFLSSTGRLRFLFTGLIILNVHKTAMKIPQVLIKKFQLYWSTVFYTD